MYTCICVVCKNKRIISTLCLPYQATDRNVNSFPLLHNVSTYFVTGDNMMFPDTGRDVIKISDFGFSHCLDGDPDLGALKQCLPVYLCPPEV